MRMFPDWYCCFLRRDRVACGGPPQRNDCWRSCRTGRCVFWSFGSQSFLRTGGVPAGARWGGSQMGARASSGTRNISSRARWPRSPSVNRNPGQAVACKKDSIGTRPFFTHQTRIGKRNRFLRIGMARSIKSFRVWRRHSQHNHEAVSFRRNSHTFYFFLDSGLNIRAAVRVTKRRGTRRSPCAPR